ncbi:hypothetical protein M9Y10_001087 [Tritrichomonas musculus]|uniref:Importin N-terminal domain-containing protein n=1 Tax=Tritrichomonas musculus TaxID=1915356 RepID=A0ABR2L617_9EUKA
MELLGTNGTKIDLNHLDSVTSLFQQQTGNVPELNQLLNNFTNREDLYVYTEEVLMSNCKSSSKFFFLLGLTKLISSKWPVIPEDFKMRNRQSLITFISQPYDPSNQSTLSEAFSALCEILKFDLDKNWPDFFDVFFSFTSNSPINGLNFLSYFASEIMSDTENLMTSNKASELMWICTDQIDRILSFGFSILQQNMNDALIIKSALPLFSILVTWIPAKAFQSPIFNLITTVFINDPKYALESCEVLIEFLRTINAFPEFVGNASQFFNMIIETLHNLCGGDYLSFPYRIANMFLNMMDKCLTNFTVIFNQTDIQAPLQHAYTWLMQLTKNADDQTIQEQCYCVWMNSYNKLLLDKVSQETRNILTQFMGPLRRTIIETIPQPYKIVTYIDDFNNETRVLQTQQFQSTLYSTVRDCFIFLTNADKEDTINAINERFNQAPELSVEDIQKLGYSIAATCGVFDEQIEDTVISSIIEKYFKLCQEPNQKVQSTEGGQMRVACGLIYMCSQYFTILNRFNTLLKAILQLILKFLTEGDFELQAVSINALKTLSQRCKTMVVFPQNNESGSFLTLLLSNTEQIFAGMAPDNIVELFRIIAIMIRVHNDDQRMNYLNQLMSGINKMWQETVMSPSFNPFDIQTCHIIELTLMCHASILLSLSINYATILKDFLPQFMSVMEALSQAIPNAPTEEILNAMKSAKSQILFILFRFSYFSYNQELIQNMVIPASFQPILNDYLNSQPQFRLKSSLKYFTAVFNRCSGTIDDLAFNAYDLIMNATLPTIVGNYSDYMDIRIEFFNLTASIVHQYSRVLALKDPPYLDMLMKTLKFGCQHSTSPICETCIELISDLFRSFKTDMPAEQFTEFFNLYCIDVVQLYFSILTDLTYKFAFQQEAMSIKNFFTIDNMKFKASEVLELLCQMYPTVNPENIMDLIQSLLDPQTANAKIKLKDFILLVKIVMPNDPDIYHDEIQKMKETLNQPFKQIPGIENINDDKKDEENLQIAQAQKVAPSPELIEQLASISIRSQS